MGHELCEPDRPLSGGIPHYWDPGDAAWYRIYHQDYHNPDPLFRRTFGPVSRFDHHQRDTSGKPCEDPDGRSAIYLGHTRRAAAAEVFWDQEPDPANPHADPRVARVCTRHRIAQIRPRGKAELLSLLDDHADDIGALPELSTGPTDDHSMAQQWALAIYEDLESDGIVYAGAHNLGACMVLWDNAPALEVVSDNGMPRDVPIQTPDVWEPMAEEYQSRTRSMIKITPDECPRCRELGLR